MKFTWLLLVLILSFSFQTTALEIFNFPTLEIEGVAHKIIDEDRWDGDWYDDSATGFCRLQGFIKSYQTSAVEGWVGPYVALDGEGGILATFPSEGNVGRFYELTQIICE